MATFGIFAGLISVLVAVLYGAYVITRHDKKVAH
jgi:hypothetical protein